MNILKRVEKKPEKQPEYTKLIERQLCVVRPGQTRLERMPDPHGHYPTDLRSLPPGMEQADLITIAHVVDGRPIGGFTWAIREK